MRAVVASIYGTLMLLRNWLYDVGFFDSVRVSTKVISVGNLTVGGTGKTPVVDLILQRFTKKGYVVGLVARNYKATSHGTNEIDRRCSGGGSYYGDEAWMLAGKHPTLPVMVGPKKWKSAVELSKKHKLDVLVVDDGFQHRELARDLDIVLFDASKPIEVLQLFPRGEARESVAALVRASFILLNKVNYSSPENLASWRQLLSGRENFAETAFIMDLSAVGERKVFAFAGLANSAQFGQALRSQLGEQLVGFQEYPDHYDYQPSDLLRLESLALQLHPQCLLITTEKDYAKVFHLQGELLLSVDILAVPLKIHFLKGEDKFYAALDPVLC